MFFKHNIQFIYKGKLNRTLKEHNDFVKAHRDKNVSMLPPFSYEELSDGKGNLDHDIQMCALEQLLNRMIIDNGKDYTISRVLDLIKSVK